MLIWRYHMRTLIPVKNRLCQVERERGISEHSTGHDFPIQNIECLDFLSCNIEGKREKFDVTISLDYSSISQDASSENRPKIVTDRARTWDIGSINTARFPNTKHRMLRSIFLWESNPAKKLPGIRGKLRDVRKRKHPW